MVSGHQRDIRERGLPLTTPDVPMGGFVSSAISELFSFDRHVLTATVEKYDRLRLSHSSYRTQLFHVAFPRRFGHMSGFLQYPH